MHINIFLTKAYYFQFLIKFRKLFVEKWKICYLINIFIPSNSQFRKHIKFDNNLINSHIRNICNKYIINMINNLDDTICKKKMGAIPKSTKYEKERKDILNKILGILEITDDNMKFYLYDVENDEIKKENIMQLKDQISICFTSKTSSVFSKGVDETKRPYLGLIKIVLKEMGYDVIVTGKGVKRNGVSIKTSAYIIHS